MRSFLTYFLVSTALALLAGIGFALVYDSSPKYDQIELIEYEKCLENRSDLRIISAGQFKNPEIADYKFVVADCQTFKPKLTN